MPARLLVLLIGLYQKLVSPLLRALFGPACRFEPSCSRYAVQAIEEHGAGRGSLLSIVRLCKCHPFHPGGYDPPPPRKGPPPRSPDVVSASAPSSDERVGAKVAQVASAAASERLRNSRSSAKTKKDDEPRPKDPSRERRLSPPQPTLR